MRTILSPLSGWTPEGTLFVGNALSKLQKHKSATGNDLCFPI